MKEIMSEIELLKKSSPKIAEYVCYEYMNKEVHKMLDE